MFDRISKYRVVWLQVCFDLPVDTKKRRKEYATFRKRIVQDGFILIQFSVYVRYCASHETADVHERRVSAWLPPDGHVWMMRLTDHQYNSSKHFWGKDRDPRKNLGPGAQLELF